MKRNTSGGALAGVLAVIIVLAILVGVVVAVVASTYNTCVTHEAAIVAQYDQNRNNYDNYFKKIKEMAQVTDMYAGDFKKIYDGVMQGRYGADGSKAMMQWIQENNPQLSPELYTRIQQAIEAGRNGFEADQKALIARKQAYDVYRKSFPNNFVVGLVGFPKIDLSKYDIVTSAETEKAFDTKKADPIQLR